MRSSRPRPDAACLQIPAVGASGGKLPARPAFNAPKASGGTGGAAPAMPRPPALVSGGAAKPMASVLPASTAAASPIAVYVPKPETEPVPFDEPIPIPAAAMETAPSRLVRACAVCTARCGSFPSDAYGGTCRFQSRRRRIPLCSSARQHRRARPLWRRLQRCRARALRRVQRRAAALWPAATAEHTRAARLTLCPTWTATATSSEPRQTCTTCRTFAAVTPAEPITSQNENST